MLNRIRIVALLVLVLGLLTAPTASFAQQTAAPPPPRFDITRFDISGNSLLPAPDLEQAVAPYTGKGKDFSDVQKALESVEQLYRRRGYGVVQVLLPEQDITRGVVQFRVLEPKVGRVIIEGNQNF